jgi:hypothetical protein
MSNRSVSVTLAVETQSRSSDGHLFARRQGLMEALASLSGFALALATWYGLNMVMKLSALNVTALIAD